MLLIQEGQESRVRMPKLAAFGSFAVNGVAEHEAELKGAVDALASAAVSGADRVASRRSSPRSWTGTSIWSLPTLPLRVPEGQAGT